ncbi:MAG: hypothetical protein KatS3mg057_2549 [Herpetosiphonaceae bacterium]|nr:MAG: hypothetical protein KatS3mg057_2549 [Herpetosiphonaceae bacterium]
MRFLRSKPSPPQEQDTTARLSMLARVITLRGVAEQYRITLEDLRPHWIFVLPFLLWQARSAYKRELKRQQRKLRERASEERG